MKVAIINHGAPGSGMSTMANSIRSELQLNKLSCKIHSTDAFFMKKGEYVFNGNMLSHYHTQNLMDFQTSIDESVDCVICDNTNLVQEHATPYIDYALEHGYLVILLHFHTDDCSSHMARCPYVIPRGSMNKCIRMANHVFPVSAFRLDVRPDSFYQALISIPKTITKKLFAVT